MLKLLLIAILAMTDSKAATTAYSIWGPIARVAKVRTGKATNWAVQVGFISPGCALDFTVLASDPKSWDAAFAALPTNKGIIGVMSQQAELHVIAGSSPNVSETAIASVQVVLDGALYGSPYRVMGPPPWHAIIPFDTTKVANGLHVQCARVFHTDGRFHSTEATIISVVN